MIAGTDTIADGLTRARSEQLWDGPVIDCDVHAHIASLEVILPYIDPAWREYMGERCVEMPGSWKSVYPPNAPSSVRPEFRLDTDEAPASSHALVQAQALEPGNLQYALLSCYAGLDSLRHPDLAAVMASAINDWLIDQWLSRDDRLRASLVVPIHTTADAIKEIERVGDHP